MQETEETRVLSLGREDPLEEGVATHSSILAWKTPWTKEPGGLESIRSQTAGHDWRDSTHTYTRGGRNKSQFAPDSHWDTASPVAHQ